MVLAARFRSRLFGVEIVVGENRFCVHERLDAGLSNNTNRAAREGGRGCDRRAIGNEDGTRKRSPMCSRHQHPRTGLHVLNGAAMQSADGDDLDEVPEASAPAPRGTRPYPRGVGSGVRTAIRHASRSGVFRWEHRGPRAGQRAIRGELAPPGMDRLPGHVTDGPPTPCQASLEYDT